MDWVQTAIDCSTKKKSNYINPFTDNKVKITFSSETNTYAFCLIPKSEMVDNLTLSIGIVNALKTKGFIKVALDEETTALVELLEDVSFNHLFGSELQLRKQLNNKFRKKKMLNNVFSFAVRNGPGKDTFKIRGMGQHCTEEVVVDGFQGVDMLLDAVYDVCEVLHEVGYLVLLAMLQSMDEVEEYFLEKVELPWGYESTEEVPFGMSYMNLLNYYKQEAPVPVDPHTDYVFLTVLPLNSKSEALEVWDLELEEWIQLEHKTEESFKTAVILIGETLSRLTNDYFVSTVHRVVSSSIPNRFSCPYFISVKCDAIIDSKFIGEDKIFGTTQHQQEDTTPSNFIWECIKSDNFTEETIMNRYHKNQKN